MPIEASIALRLTLMIERVEPARQMIHRDESYAIPGGNPPNRPVVRIAMPRSLWQLPRPFPSYLDKRRVARCEVRRGHWTGCYSLTKKDTPPAGMSKKSLPRS